QGLVALQPNHLVVEAGGAQPPADQRHHRQPQVEPQRPEERGERRRNQSLRPRLQVRSLDDQRSWGSSPRSGLFHLARFPVVRNRAFGTPTTVVSALRSQKASGYQIIQKK